MGAALTYLTEPITTKEPVDGAVADRARFGGCGMQGWRRGMEDSHLAVPNLDGKGRMSLFGVFDGHGGRGVARFAAKHLPDILLSTEAFKDGDYPKALKATFLAVDERLRSPAGRQEMEQLDAPSEGSNSRVPLEVPRRIVAQLRSRGLTKEKVQGKSEETSEANEGKDANEPEGENGVSNDAANENGVGNDAANSSASEGNSDDTEEVDAEGDKDEEQDDDDSAESEYVEIDPQSMRDISPEGQGAVAVVALIIWDEEQQGAQGAKIFVANAGDSRCVLCRDTEIRAEPEGVALSDDHKPELPGETARIEAAGGHVQQMPGGARVQGDLNLSRALGDLRYKQRSDLPAEKQIVTADPEILERSLDSNDNFLILACDGIWERNENGPLSQALHAKLHEAEAAGIELTLSKLAGEVCDWSLCPSMDQAENPSFDGSGCDNMTIMLVEFKKAASKCMPNAEEPSAKRSKTDA